MYTIDNTKVTKKNILWRYIYIYLYVFIELRYIYIYVYGWCREGKGWAKGEGNKATLSGVVLNKSSQARKKIINVLIRRLPPRHIMDLRKQLQCSWTSATTTLFSKEESMPRQGTQHAAHVHKECPAFWGRERAKKVHTQTHTIKIRHRSCHSGCSSLWKKLVAWRHNPTQYTIHALFNRYKKLFYLTPLAFDPSTLHPTPSNRPETRSYIEKVARIIIGPVRK